jgi:cytochrome c oxidase subunit III
LGRAYFTDVPVLGGGFNWRVALLPFPSYSAFFNLITRAISSNTQSDAGSTVTNSSLTVQAAAASVEGKGPLLRLPAGRLGMWVFLISDAVTFATLLVSSALLRLWSHDWPAPATVLNLPVAGVMTGLLLASSIAMAFSLTALKQGKQTRFSVALLLTIVGGVSFLLLQAWEWSHLLQQGLTLGNNPWGARLFGASFYVLTGFHGAHVIAGVVYLSLILLYGLRGRYHSGNSEPVAIAGLYWYFVDVSWLFILLIVYLL